LKKRQQSEGISVEERERRKAKKKKKEEARAAEKAAAEAGEDDCSAANPKCKRPTGKQVHWVQCDKCELWYHLYCIGLKPHNIKEDEDFCCRNCKQPSGKGGKGGSGSDMDTD